MAMPVDRTLPKACMCHISLAVMAGRHVAGAVDGRHRLHPYHTIYPSIHPVAFVISPSVAETDRFFPPCSVARTLTGGRLAWSQLDNYYVVKYMRSDCCALWSSYVILIHSPPNCTLASLAWLATTRQGHGFYKTEAQSLHLKNFKIHASLSPF